MVDFTTQGPETLSDGRVSISFSATESGYIHNDALVMSAQDFQSMSEADLQMEMQRRWDNWYAFLTAPPEENPDPEGLIDG